MSRARSTLLLGLLTIVLGFGLPAAPVAAAASPPIRPEEGQIERLYRAALGRPAEPGGFEYWVARRLTDMTLEDVAGFFLSSDEFDRRFGAPDDESFVALVYRQVLDREPDDGGRRYWLDRLGDGLSRRRLVLLFAESSEFIDRTGTRLSTLPAFQATVRTVTAADLGASWRSGCPVGPSRLRLLLVRHVNAAGTASDGRIVVHESVVDEAVAVFARLYETRFPIGSLRTIDEFGGDDNASMAAGNSSGFNCRTVTGGTTWSLHAYGRAVDLNPVQNPFVRGDTVLPPSGRSYLNRAGYDPLMVREGDAVTRAFDAVGWRWGGRWTSLRDYQHFELR